MRYWTQFLGAIAASIGLLIIGTALGFATIALPQLLEETNLNVQMDENMGSWFASVLWICGLFSSPSGGILSGKLGRRSIILYCTPFVLLGWVLMGLAHNTFMLFSARIITASFSFLFLSSLGVYISETVHPSIRSSLVILPVCFMASGHLMVFFFGYYLGWRITALMVSVPITVFFTMMYFLPETPYWLVENDQIDSAKKSLQFYRGPDYDITEELVEIHEKHKSKMMQEDSQTWRWTLKRFRSSAFWKPYFSIGVLGMLHPLSGFDTCIVYMIPIVKDAGYSYDPGLVPIVVGAIRVFCAGLIPLFIQHMSPKILYSVCQFVKTLDIAALGILSFLHANYPDLPILHQLGWLPMALMINILIMRAIGTLPVMSILLAESYPTDIRTQAVGFTDCGTLFIGAIITKIYPNIAANIGFHGASIVFVVVGFINAVWGAITIPDNRGKSLIKVEEQFENK